VFLNDTKRHHVYRAHPGPPPPIRYIDYNSMIMLCDYHTGHFIDMTSDQVDYIKGLVWIDPASRPDLELYPLDCLSFGRGSTPCLYRIHDEKCVPIGPLPSPEWDRQWREPR